MFRRKITLLRFVFYFWELQWFWSNNSRAQRRLALFLLHSLESLIRKYLRGVRCGILLHLQVVQSLKLLLVASNMMSIQTHDHIDIGLLLISGNCVLGIFWRTVCRSGVVERTCYFDHPINLRRQQSLSLLTLIVHVVKTLYRLKLNLVMGNCTGSTSVLDVLSAVLIGKVVCALLHKASKMRRIYHVVTPSFPVQPRISAATLVYYKVILNLSPAISFDHWYSLDILEFNLSFVMCIRWYDSWILRLIFMVNYLFCSRAWLNLDVMLNVLEIRTIIFNLFPVTTRIWVFFILLIFFDAVHIFYVYIWCCLAS